MADDEQASMIVELKQGGHSAWSDAVDRHLHEIYGFVFHLVGGNRTVAEDLNQEIWLEAMDGIEHCDAERGCFRNWLFGIARRRVALHYRKRAFTDKLTSLDDQSEKAADPREDSVLPEDVLEKVERNAVVRAAILVLPEDRREALLGKYVDGLSVDNIATRMGRTAKAVESLLSRSREQLQDLLRGYAMPSEDSCSVARELTNE